MNIKQKIAAVLFGLGISAGVVSTATARPSPELCEVLIERCDAGDAGSCALAYWCFN